MAWEVVEDVLRWVGSLSASSLVGGIVGLVLGARYQKRLERRDGQQGRRRYRRQLTRRQSTHGGIAIAGRSTRAHLMEGDGQPLLLPTNVDIRLDREPIELGPVIRVAREQALQRIIAATSDDRGVESAWNSEHLVALRRYRISRTGRHEDPTIQVTVSPTDYATFTATVTDIDETIQAPGHDGGTRATSVRQEFLPDDDAVARAIERPLPQLAIGLGVAVLLITEDHKVILTRRR